MSVKKNLLRAGIIFGIGLVFIVPGGAVLLTLNRAKILKLLR